MYVLIVEYLSYSSLSILLLYVQSISAKPTSHEASRIVCFVAVLFPLTGARCRVGYLRLTRAALTEDRCVDRPRW